MAESVSTGRERPKLQHFCRSLVVRVGQELAVLGTTKHPQKPDDGTC